MHKITAHERRATLGVDQLGQLLVALKDDLERYRTAVRGSSPEKMVTFGLPYLVKLEGQVGEVEALVQQQTNGG